MNKKFMLLFIIMSICLMLVACDEEKSDSQLKEEGKMFDNVLQFKGYIRVLNDHVDGKSESQGVRKKVYEDSSTGCLYLLDSEDGYMPLYDENGQVDGCRGITNDSEKVQEDYLKLLSEYYPDSDDSELEYMLESVFDYKNKSIKELRDTLEFMRKEKEDE